MENTDVKKIKSDKAVKHKEAKKLFQTILSELQKDDALNQRTLIIANNMAVLEQMKQEFIADIQERGVVELFVNGSQQMYRENKSAASITRIVEQQRKLQTELKMTPASDKTVKQKIEVDEFEDF